MQFMARFNKVIHLLKMLWIEAETPLYSEWRDSVICFLPDSPYGYPAKLKAIDH
jgi:hypothetical protein